MKKNPRKQCPTCPWRKGADPFDIHNYDPEMHKKLTDTIAEPGVLKAGEIKLMACHETYDENLKPCVGWLANQLGVGNNLRLRMAVMRGKIDANVITVGEQHLRFEDTLPKRRRRR